MKKRVIRQCGKTLIHEKDLNVREINVERSQEVKDGQSLGLAQTAKMLFRVSQKLFTN